MQGLGRSPDDPDRRKENSYKVEKAVLPWQDPGSQDPGMAGGEPGVQMKNASNEEKGVIRHTFFIKPGRSDKAMQDFPCKNCQKRYVGCHGKCDEFVGSDRKRPQKGICERTEKD